MNKIYAESNKHNGHLLDIIFLDKIIEEIYTMEKENHKSNIQFTVMWEKAASKFSSQQYQLAKTKCEINAQSMDINM